MPCGTIAYCSNRWALFAVNPSTCIGAGRDIDSTPPATTKSCWPDMTPIAANVTACWPDPQNRLSVTPGASMLPSCVERSHAGDVHAVVAAAGSAPHDHVVDVSGVEPVPVAQRVQHLREDPLRVDRVQRTVLLALATR